jgi:hypothetical protein
MQGEEEATAQLGLGGTDLERFELPSLTERPDLAGPAEAEECAEEER